MKRVALYVLIAIALIALAIVFWRLNEVLIVAFGGVVGAVAVRTLALPLSRWIKLPERWAIMVVVVGFMVLVVTTGWLFGRQVADQAAEMQQVMTESMTRITDWLRGSALGSSLVSALSDSSGNSRMLSGVGLAAGAMVSAVVTLVLVFFLTIYFALSPQEYLRGLIRLVPLAGRERVRGATENAGEVLRKWLVAQLVAMVIVGALVGISLALLGVPLAFLLGMLAGLLEFIPVAGPVLFSIPGILVAFARSPTMAIYALIVYVVVQQFESNVIIPLLQRWALQLPPVISLLSVIVGGLLFGPMGLVLATPLAVVGVSLVKRLYIEETLEQSPHDAATAGESPR